MRGDRSDMGSGCEGLHRVHYHHNSPHAAMLRGMFWTVWEPGRNLLACKEQKQDKPILVPEELQFVDDRRATMLCLNAGYKNPFELTSDVKPQFTGEFERTSQSHTRNCLMYLYETRHYWYGMKDFIDDCRKRGVLAQYY